MGFAWKRHTCRKPIRSAISLTGRHNAGGHGVLTARSKGVQTPPYNTAGPFTSAKSSRLAHYGHETATYALGVEMPKASDPAGTKQDTRPLPGGITGMSAQSLARSSGTVSSGIGGVLREKDAGIRKVPASLDEAKSVLASAFNNTRKSHTIYCRHGMCMNWEVEVESIQQSVYAYYAAIVQAKKAARVHGGPESELAARVTRAYAAHREVEALTELVRELGSKGGKTTFDLVRRLGQVDHDASIACHESLELLS